MIDSQEKFCVICDKCKKIFVNADGESWFDSYEKAGEEAFEIECTKEDGSIDYDYNFVEGEHEGECFCPKCAKELGLLDDDDE